MYIKLEKENIIKIKNLIYDNPNKQFGVILGEDLTMNMWRIRKTEPKKMPKDFPIGKHGIVIYTYPLTYFTKRLKYDNTPPEDWHFIESLEKRPENDAVVFDKSGIWVYRPNKFFNLVNIDDKLIKQLKPLLYTQWFNLISKQIDIDTYLKRIKNLAITDKDNKNFIGFDIKYYLYDNIKDINLKYTSWYFYK